ncbi:MAG: DUF3089 domain-containing protein [Solirubrobacteraceae bacterium]
MTRRIGRHTGTGNVALLTAGVALAFAVLMAAGATASARTVWLCRPGQAANPCRVSLSTTVYSPTLHPLRVVHPRAVRHPAIDCFYVYPTVSDQTTTNANLRIDPEERSIALYQAARYSQYCRVFAPMYRQITVPALQSGNRETPAQLALPLRDVRSAFETYLHRYSHGRGFVLIGHSQGSFVLEQLIAKVIDRSPALRARLVSAILLGGNVLVPKPPHPPVGGSFRHVPACRAAAQLHCVIAFSSFDQTPPANSLFGRTTVHGERVLCTNPAKLGGGWARIDPIFPSAPFAPGTLIAAGISLLHLTHPQPATEWVSEPGAYRARCSSAAGANVLQVQPLGGAQTPTASPDPTWGLHLLDAQVELGDLLTVVRTEAQAYAARPAAPLVPAVR